MQKNSLKKVKEFLETSSTYMDIEKEETNVITLTTRENGDVQEEEHSQKDFDEAVKVNKRLSEIFEDSIKTDIEVVDEWVYLYIMPNIL